MLMFKCIYVRSSVSGDVNLWVRQLKISPAEWMYFVIKCAYKLVIVISVCLYVLYTSKWSCTFHTLHLTELDVLQNLIISCCRAVQSVCMCMLVLYHRF